MNVKYCLPIIQNSQEKVLSKISENPGFDFYEIWLSYVKDLDLDFIWKISDQYSGKLLFLFRKKDLEKSDLKKEDREKIVKLLETSGNFLDLDINDQKEDLDFIKKEKLNNKLIVSYHNYENTPGLSDLENFILKMDVYSPAIYKFSCFCKDEEDGVKLLTLLVKLKKENKRFLVSGMGKEGRIVRIYSALWGNEFNFAPVDQSGESAPGQIARNELENILEILKNGG